jgi:hypothetical protein
MYEYKVVPAFNPMDTNYKQDQEEINNYAREGWRLVSVVKYNKDYVKYFFERKVNDSNK